MKTNTWIWIALVLLSASSFWLSGTPQGATVAITILGAAGVKATLVGWQFMELRSAHLAWKLGFPLLLVGTLGLICLLSRIA